MSGLSKEDFDELLGELGIKGNPDAIKKLRRGLESTDEGQTTPLDQISIRELTPFINATTALIHLNQALKGKKSMKNIALSQVDPDLREKVDVTLTDKGNVAQLTYYAGPTHNMQITILRQLTPIYAVDEMGILKIELEDFYTNTKSQLGPRNENKSTGGWFASVFQRTQEALTPSRNRGH